MSVACACLSSVSPSPHRPSGTSIAKVDRFNHVPWLCQLEVGTGWHHAGSSAGVAAAAGAVASVAAVASAALADPCEPWEPSVGGAAPAAPASMKVEAAADEEEEAEDRGRGDAAAAADQSGANIVVRFHFSSSF